RQPVARRPCGHTRSVTPTRTRPKNYLSYNKLKIKILNTLACFYAKYFLPLFLIMTLTQKSFLILLIGIACIGLSFFWAFLLLIAFVIILAWAVFTLIDYRLIPDKDSFEISRELAEKLSLGDPNQITLTLHNKTKRLWKGYLGDNVPMLLQIRDAIFFFSIQGNEQISFCYTITPRERGKYEFEAVNLRIIGILGLVRQDYEYILRNKVSVYPGYLKLKEYQLLARKNQLEQMGRRSIRKYGEGREFESLREYTKDDEYRRINWKATARRAKPIVAQYQIERNQNIIIVLDAGRMMRNSDGFMKRLDYAINATLMLSYICANKEDNVGILVFGSKVQTYLPPKRGIQQVHAISEILHNLQYEMTEPNYSMAFQYIKNRINKRALIILITDIIDRRASDILIREFTRLSPKHLPLCVTLRDKELHKVALNIPQNAEQALQMGIAEQILEQRLLAFKYLQLNGVLTLDTLPENLTAKVINEYLTIKAKSLL
ncbi:MAG: DUF58 domain-containing protein, partial [Bacteroidia bacterium]|nr:DUF58 domain-containing protein [Bacteroidia bacterium]MDW8348328.1 DUF58 domain-containing protein [Bacteroidia bacterium]